MAREPGRNRPWPNRGRSGFVLPLLIFLVLVVAGILFGVDRVVQGFRNRSNRFRDGETAYQAARSGSRIAERAFESLFNGPPPASGSGRAIFDLMTASLPEELNGGEDGFDVPLLREVLPEGEDASIEVLVRFDAVRALDLPRPGGFHPDPREKTGRLRIQTVARVGDAVRRIVVLRPFWCFYRLPPVLGRFSLLLGSLEGTRESLNVLDYVPRLGLFFKQGTSELSWPLTVYPMPSDETPGTSAARFAPDPLLPMKRGGWVGLFGPTPWILNTTFGPGQGSPLEEGHGLRNFASVFPSPSVPGSHEKARRFGFARRILELPIFAPEERDRVAEGSSLLHLSGDARRPVPPVVLGRAFRRYLTWSKLGAGPDGPFTSFHGIDEGNFEEALPGVTQATGLAPAWSAYQEVMARSVLEPYNRTYDFLVTDDETRDEQGRIVAGDSPWNPPRALNADAVRPMLAPRGGPGPAGFLYPTPGGVEEAGLGGALVLADEAGTPLYEGGTEGILGGMAQLVRDRSLVVVEDSGERGAVEQFESRFMTAGRALSLGTTVRVAASTLALGPVEVKRGGTLAVEGNILVSGPIRVAPGEVLALVSLGGDVVIGNEQPIEAMLVSCTGQVLPSSRGVDVRGGIVASRFDPLRWSGVRGACRVVYDPRLDPASVPNRARQYLVRLGTDRDMILERH